MTDFSTNNSSIAKPDRALAMVGPERTPVMERLFSIFLWDIANRTIIENDSVDPMARIRGNKAEYYFRVPPKVHEMDEPFATHITPTQGGGKYVESFGSILKEVRISGTTGLRPKKQSPREIPVTGITEEQLRSLSDIDSTARTIPRNEITGIDDIIMMRNLFRLYSDNKANNELSRNTIMVWRNVRTDDYWVVEPKDFKLIQNAQSPLTYQYSISLTTLTRFEAAVSFEADPQKGIRDRRRLLTRIQGYSQDLSQIYLNIASRITEIQGAGYFGISTALGPILSTLRGLNEIKKSGEAAYRGLTATTRDMLGEVVSGIADLVDFLPPQHEVIRELRRAQLVAAKILTEEMFQDTVTATYPDKRRRAEHVYSTAGLGPGTPSGRGSTRPFISNEPRGDRVASGTVMGGETIRDVARRLLGDPLRWHVLVLLNDLRAPYISREAADGVLTPGDIILYPSSSGPSADLHMIGEVNPSVDEAEGNRSDLSNPLVRAYGRDLALTTVDNAFDLADLAVSNYGDLSTIAGIDNVDQAVKVKFATEQGELPCHKYFGAKFPIGTKATMSSFNEFRVNVITTLKSDARIDRISSLRFNTVGDMLTVSADLVLSKTRDSLQTNFALRQT